MTAYCLEAKYPSMLIIVVLNSQSGNSAISAIAESGSDAGAISSNCVFCLLVCLVFFFVKIQTLSMDKNDWGKQA